MRSSPSPPSRTSLPPFPQMRSSPPPPKTMSRPRRPTITSAPGVPSIRSSPSCPRIVALSPKQVGAHSTCRVPSIPALGQSTSSSEQVVFAKVSTRAVPGANVEKSFAITTTAQDTCSPAEHENGVEPPPFSVTPPGGWISTTPTEPDSAAPTHESVPSTCTVVGESRNAVGAVVTTSECEAQDVEGTTSTTSSRRRGSGYGASLYLRRGGTEPGPVRGSTARGSEMNIGRTTARVR